MTPPPGPPTRPIPILCSDSGHVGRGRSPSEQLGTIDWPAGRPGGALAAWGYLCGTCTDAWHGRRADFAAANPGLPVRDREHLTLTNPPAPSL